MGDEVVKDFRGVRFYRYWWSTLKLARKNVATDCGSMTGNEIRRRTLMSGVENPVFILGCPRSGTTYLGRMLAELPSVSYYFEPPILKYYSRLVYEGSVTVKQATKFYRQACRSLMLFAPGRGSRFIEKNPKHTWVAEALYHAFPDAQFVVISRDGRDVAASLREKPWHLAESASTVRREPGGYRYGPFAHFYIESDRSDEYHNTTDLHRCIWIWRRYAEEIRRLGDVVPNRSQLHLRYEDLVLESDTTISRLAEFIGESDSDSIDRLHKFSRTGKTTSVGRWKNTFSAADLATIEREAGELLHDENDRK